MGCSIPRWGPLTGRMSVRVSREIGLSIVPARLRKPFMVQSMHFSQEDKVDVSPAAPDWTILRKSLEFELKMGCMNFEGKQLKFSNYAQKAVQMLSPPSTLRKDHEQVCRMLMDYDSLSLQSRKDAVKSALSFVALGSQSIDEQGLMDKGGFTNSHMKASEEAQACSAAMEDASSEAAELRSVYPPLDSKDAEGYLNVLGPKKKRVKGTALEHREIFSESAKRLSQQDPEELEKIQYASQKSAEWSEGRKNRLTASNFGAVLGLLDKFDENSVVNLWEEKTGFREPFKGNKFTVWGTRKEPVALDHYQQATGYEVSSHGLKLLGNDSVHSWIGASPDGIVTPDPQSSRALAPQFVGKGNGVLEVKCPHGRDPSTAHPGEYLRDYYYAQIQGQMDMLDLEWCHLFSWTESNGAALYYVARNREYWQRAYKLLAEFWWEHVIPARVDLRLGKTDISEYCPPQSDPRRNAICQETLEIVDCLPRAHISSWN